MVRGGARCVSQVLHRCAQPVSRGAARCASQVNDRGANADAEAPRMYLIVVGHFFSPGGCNRGSECCWFSHGLAHGDPTAAGTAPESRHAEARIAPEKKGRQSAIRKPFPRANGIRWCL
jgi:hypothetical protein